MSRPHQIRDQNRKASVSSYQSFQGANVLLLFLDFAFQKRDHQPPEQKSVSPLRFAGGEGAQRRSGQRIFGTRPKSRTAKDRAFSGAHTLPLPPAEETQAAGASGSGKVQARPRTGSGGAGQTKALSGKGIRQASGGEVESTRVARKATPARGKALGRHVSAASRPNPESG